MSDFIFDIFKTTVYVAGIGSLILAIPTVIYLVRASKKNDGAEHHFMNIFLAIVAVAIFCGLFFNIA